MPFNFPMKLILRSFAFLLAFAALRAFADSDTLYSVECCITPKSKDCKVAKVISSNIKLEESSLTFPVVSPANETLIVTVVLIPGEDANANPVRKGKKAAPAPGPAGIQVGIQDPSRVTITGSDRVVSPLTVFSAQLPYNPKEALPLFENNDFSLSILVKSAAEK
jgi:hypothetical protein